jgi:hypothetical protein
MDENIDLIFLEKLSNEKNIENINKVANILIESNSNLNLLIGFLKINEQIKTEITSYNSVLQHAKKIASDVGFSEERIKFLFVKFENK